MSYHANLLCKVRRHRRFPTNILIGCTGGIRCAKNVTIHNAAILSVNAGEHWLGIGAADNSLSLFHRPQERLGGFSGAGPKMAGWQLYRTPQKTVAMVYSLFTSFAHIIPRIYVILLFHEPKILIVQY